MAQLTVQNVVRAGLVPSYAAAAAGGDSFKNEPLTILHVKNGSAAAITVTVTSQTKNVPEGTTKTNLTVNVAAGSEAMIGPFSRSAFNDSNGLVQVTYSAVTSVTVAAVRVQ